MSKVSLIRNYISIYISTSLKITLYILYKYSPIDFLFWESVVSDSSFGGNGPALLPQPPNEREEILLSLSSSLLRYTLKCREELCTVCGRVFWCILSYEWSWCGLTTTWRNTHASHRRRSSSRSGGTRVRNMWRLWMTMMRIQRMIGCMGGG